MLSEELNATPLGPREHWPQSLRAACTLCFDTPLPACLVWGTARVQLTNPGYASLAAAWREVWPTIQSPLDRAFAGEGSRIDLGLGPESPSTLTLSLTPIRNDAALVEGVLIVAIDASANQEVQRLRDDLETLNYVVAHDLHSPLRTMQEIARIVSEGPPKQIPEDVLPFVQHLGQGVTKLAAKADEIVRFARTIRQPLKQSRVDVGDMVSALADEFSAKAGDRSVRVSIHALPDAVGDAGLLRELFANVLSNAFKFTSHTAETRIEIGGARDGPMVMYHVRDNGAGFDMKYAGRLFKPFPAAAREAQFEGTGVGLAIANLHRQTSWWRDARRRDVTGRSDLSFLAARRGRLHRNESPDAAWLPKDPDHRRQRDELRACRTICCAGRVTPPDARAMGRPAYARHSKTRPTSSCAISTCRGSMVTKSQRRCGEVRNRRQVPLLAFTADTPGVTDQALAAGFSGYIFKPVDPQSFPTTISQFVPTELRAS